MYNSGQKQSFLNTITNDNSYRSYQKVFKAVEDMEEKFCKDISEMSVDEVLVVLDLKTGTRRTSTEQYMSLLRIYVDWCIQNGKVSGENNLEKIDSSEIDKTRLYRSKYIKNPEELEEMISAVFKKDFYFNETVDNPKELCIRLCYEGMEDEEIVKLKKTDVDYDNKVIHSPIYEDVMYKVSDRILWLCKYCSDMTEIEYANISKSGRVERICDNDYVIRARIGTLRGKSANEPIQKTVIIRRVKEFNDKYVEATDVYKSVTSSKLRESHLFYLIHCSANKDRFIKDAVANEAKIKNPDISDRNMYEKIRQIKTSYEMWEEAFY